MASSPCSSSPHSHVRRHHDVFLSFRGDTRHGFTSHLFNELDKKGFHTFIDGKLPRGENISDSLIATIRGSKISIIVFSQAYASSKWCLDELVEIITCHDLLRLLVYPIFYKVDPSEIRNHRGCFGDALAKFEAHPTNKYKDKLPKWKIALNKAANLSGWHLTNGDESQFIQRIVEAVSCKLNRTRLHVAKYPVGIESRLQDLASLVSIGENVVKVGIDSHLEDVASLASIGKNDVKVIGIYGIGGIGKTTIAKAAFNKFADDFEGSSFLANVRESSEQYCGLVQLQETLLFDMLGDRTLKVGNTHRGINIIRDRLGYKRILLVLDDVDQLEQLESLAGGHDWFGSGSRIIITTRYKHFLTTHGADETYEVKELDYSEALKLLSWNAFKENNPVEGYYELSERVVNYANGLPLALVISGSYLCKRSKSEWKSAIENLERKPNKHVYEILKISYDALQDDEKAVFLDIACFFIGEDQEYVIKILGSSKFCPTIGMAVLIDMSLVTIVSGKVRMHQLIQEVGTEIVSQESLEVGKRSRLWLAEDVFHVFLENMGTNAIEGIKLDLPMPKTLDLSAKAFKKMKRLRLLTFRNVVVSTAIRYFPTELRLIDWPGYQFPTLPLNSGLKQLVILNMPRSRIQRLGKAFKNFDNLKIMNLSSSEFLTKIPDLSTAPNLESLYLDNCTNLVEIHESVGYLNRLTTLDLRFCCKLKILPSSLELNHLETLNLLGCYSLRSVPNFGVEMKYLKNLTLSGTLIKELPSSIDHLTALQVLILSYCEELKHIPSSIYELHHLEHLDLCGCSSLCKFPTKFTFSESNDSLQSSELLPFALQKDPNSSLKFHFPKLVSLELQNCNLSEVDFLSTPNGFRNLELLNLAENKFVNLPSIKNLSNLKNLHLSNCELLQEILDFPRNVLSINASGCKSLLDTRGKITDIMYQILWNIQQFWRSEIQVILPGCDIPHWFSNRCEGDSIDFILDSNDICEKRFGGVIICAVFELDCNAVSLTLTFDSWMNNDHDEDVPIDRYFPPEYRIMRTVVLVKSGHMWLHYFPRNVFWRKGRYNVSFAAVEKRSTKNFITRCGVHVLQDDRDEIFKVPCSLSKRGCADYTYIDNESSWYPKKKRHRGALRIKELVTDQPHESPVASRSIKNKDQPHESLVESKSIKNKGKDFAGYM